MNFVLKEMKRIFF